MLSVYLSYHCPSFRRARELLAFLHRTRPVIPIKVIIWEEEDVYIPEEVLGTPTYLFNGRVVSLGNPSEEELLRLVGG